ncbi:MAG: potassium-transporting ATPase subunit KdpA [Pirellulaceae bacterium]|nr:potassium-transporting ATPase subunit KdpA [Pirellulaceae bacterium]
MSWDIAQILLYFATLAICIQPLGLAIARVFDDRPSKQIVWVRRSTDKLCRWLGIRSDLEMTSRQYTTAVIVFSLMSIVVVYGLQRYQDALPLNPEDLPSVSIDSSLNTAISFVTNTNWQGYAGESTLSYFTQMVALTVQNFLSAAVGLAVLMAFIRGFTRKNMTTIGNFYADVVRATLFILLPLSFVLAIALVSQGVVQTLAAYPQYNALEQPSTLALPQPQPASPSPSQPRLAVGPVASQVAIKQLGTNGGGFFNTNSAHPLENPTPLSNLLEMIAILLIPAALCVTFGELVNDSRQGRALLLAMTCVFVPLVCFTYVCEQAGNPRMASLGVDQQRSDWQSGGNMEGKETRLGIVNSALWSVATTAASNGSVNAMHDSFTPLGGLVLMWLMQIGEVIFGGVGSGLYGMLVFAILTVFLAGLMVGRTPEYLGKKIGVFEMKMVSLAILLPCGAVLLGTALAVVLEQGKATIFNPGPHGFSEVLYALSSAGNNNGSAFAGLGANTPFYNLLLGIAMLVGRFGVILPVLAMAGSLASKNSVPVGAGTLPTHTPLYIVLLITVVLLVGALSFLPALALGPIAEQQLLYSNP